MESSILKRAGRFLREQSKNKRWRRVLTVLGACVVFVTAYVLLMPAVALQRKTPCELEEHTHTEECYGQLVTCGRTGTGDETEEPVTLEFSCAFLKELHVHTQECYDGEGELVCGIADYAVHEHNDGCYEEGILVCSIPEVEEHEHTDACYRINDSGFICGQEESEAHKHTDACYTERKELTCEEAEGKGHTHTAECYTEEEKVICKEEESAGHTHTDACYGEDGALICEEEESEGHTHDPETCYETAEKLVCSEGEEKGHQHGDSCYMVNRELTCGKEENLVGHTHTEKCRGVVKELVCGKEEVILHLHTEKDCYEAVLDKDGKQKKDENGDLLWELVCELPEVTEHIHNEECYQEHAHTEECYQEGLICGLEEHTHTEECEEKEEDAVFYCASRIHSHTADCYDEEGKLSCGQANFVVHTHDETCYAADERLLCPLSVIEEHAHVEDCYDKDGNLACVHPAVELHTHTEECYDEEGVISCRKLIVLEHTHSEECFEPGLVKEGESFTKIYTGDSYIVTVEYGAEANIPEEAELLVEEITPENGEEHYAEQESRFKEALADEGAFMKTLLKVGFYLDGEEIEPESGVTVTVQFLDENGMAEGSSVTVVHFGEEDTEVLDNSNVENSSTTFQMNSFSEIAIGYRTGENGTIHLSESFEYEDEAFHITFHVEGDAALPEEAGADESLELNEELASEETEETEETEALDTSDEAKTEEQEGPVMLFTEEEMEEEIASEDSSVEGSEAAETENEGAETQKNEELSFAVTPLKEDSEECASAAAYAEEVDEESELLLVQALSYSLSYKGEELDLSECVVTAEVTPAEALSQFADEADTFEASPEESEEAETDIAVGVLELSEEKEVNALNTMVLGEDEKMVVTTKEDTIVLYAASQANPRFQVQYYANLSRVVDSNNISQYEDIDLSVLDGLNVIDTSGGNLPQNGKGGAVIKNIYIEKIGDKDGKIKKQKALTEVCKVKDFEYIKSPGINHFNSLIENGGYNLKEIWVLNHNHMESCYNGDGGLICEQADSTNAEDWTVWPYDSNLHFTNRKVTAEGNAQYILINDKSTIRLVYDPTTGEKNIATTFYDYDISDGEHRSEGGVQYMNTSAYGINSSTNCDAASKYAFGNGNVGTAFGENTWNGNNFNKSNPLNQSTGCTFGLVSGVSGDSPNFNVSAPKIFGPEPQIGKSIFSTQYSLDFSREGDTYTLTGVPGSGLGGLDTFHNNGISWSTKRIIWSNDFWPMDSAPTWGADGHDMKFGSKAAVDNRKFAGANGAEGSLPACDDGFDHNSYFGMSYSVDFELTEDYAGPLEYLFFGDDDMWVFLCDEQGNSQLVCDIGGVHASVGEYVDLWDYMRNEDDGSNKTGKHTLKFFYTERGASGSTCWMQFTLPSVTSIAPDQLTSSLKVRKFVTSKEDGEKVDLGDEFQFKIHFTDKDGKNLPDDYSYIKYDANGNECARDLIIWDGGEFTLKAGEYIEVKYLPVGTKFTIEELEHDDRYYYTQILVGGKEQRSPGEVVSKKLASGEILAEGVVVEAVFNNSCYVYELPETGGAGTNLYTMAGISLLLIAGLMYRKKFGERRGASSRN